MVAQQHRALDLVVAALDDVVKVAGRWCEVIRADRPEASYFCLAQANGDVGGPFEVAANSLRQVAHDQAAVIRACRRARSKVVKVQLR